MTIFTRKNNYYMLQKYFYIINIIHLNFQKSFYKIVLFIIVLIHFLNNIILNGNFWKQILLTNLFYTMEHSIYNTD